MARQAVVNIDNNFIQGLITEAGALSFPEKACTETYDCIFSRTGKVLRRPGLNAEVDAVPFAVSDGVGIATTEYLWTAVGGSGAVSILVVQQGDKLYFFDVDNTATVSSTKRAEEFDLDSYLPSGSNKITGLYSCSFSQGNGDLLIAHPAIPPLYISYNSATNTLTATAITVQFRDFQGLSSEVSGLTTRPTKSVSTLKSDHPNHFYNLLNQGWYANSADALTQWDTALTTMPSMADVPGLFRASETDTFDPARVSAKDGGNVPAPKGHFILTAWDQDRTAAMTAEGFTGVGLATVMTLISQSSGTLIFDSTLSQGGGGAAAFDGSVNLFSNGAWGGANSISVVSRGIGKTLSSASRIGKVIIKGSNGEGFVGAGSNPSVTLTLRGKQGTAPSSLTDGTSLGSTTFTDTTNESSGRTINSSNTSTYWDHVWVVITTQDNMAIAEVEFYDYAVTGSEGIPVTTTERPSCVAFFAGRVWYAGLDSSGLSNNIYFSQIIENKSQYGQCYQKNDPAGEYYNDLLADDGGIVKILEMGSVIKLFVTRSALFCFATNGVWSISGSTGSGFKATDYVVRRISNIGTTARLSFVDFKGLPLWWAEDGIYAMTFDANTDSFEAQNVTLKTIKTFYTGILPEFRKLAKGVYDPINDYVYWLYKEALPSNENNHTYNRILVMNGATGALFPWTISGMTEEGVLYDKAPLVHGIAYVVDPTLSTASRVKFITIKLSDADLLDYKMSFAEIRNVDGLPYYDWAEDFDWGGFFSYSSYFITGYKIHGDTQRFTQPNYLFVFMETEDNASMRVQSIFDFTNSGNSGKWSSIQEAYNNNLYANRDVSIRRLKMRGKGRAMQFKFQSSTGKPFTALGWSVMESGNSSV